ncbi:MAG: CxxC-x17-CxxC domain-containing protein [Candidatus Levyibacteriota bacterium]
MAYPGRDNRGADRGGRRDFDGGGRDFGRDRERPQMHSVTCANCGKDAQVPFRPTSGRPVYCSDCFEKMQGRSSGGNESRGFERRDNRDSRDRGPRPSFNDRPKQAPRNDQLDAINTKLDKILNLLSNTKALKADAKAQEVVKNEVAGLMKDIKADKTIKPKRKVVKKDVKIVEPAEPIEVAPTVEKAPTE